MTNITMVTFVTKGSCAGAQASAAAQLRPLLFWGCIKFRLVVGYQRLWTTYQSHAT